MDFQWSDDQIKLHQNAISFSRSKLGGELISQDRNSIFDRKKWVTCAEVGLLGLPLPEEFGGANLDPLTCAFVLEGVGYGCKDNGLLLSIGAQLWAVEIPILLFGNQEQKNRYLPKLCSGEWIGAHATTEPDSGSDAMSLSTKAVIDGGDYIINGRKSFITNGPCADVFLTFATLNKKQGYTSITAFLIERSTPGVKVGPQVEKMGTKTSPMSDIVFENCRVSAANRLGPEKFGAKIFSTIMKWERSLILAPFLGAIKRQIEDCVVYANERKQFGKRLSGFQSVTNRIVEMHIRLEAAKLLLYKAAWSIARNDTLGPSSTAKIWTSEAAVQTFLDAIQIFGGYGYASEFEIERYLRDAVASRIYSGTSDIHRMVIAAEIGLKI